MGVGHERRCVCAGVERLCADLGLDPADRKVLILAWKMNAQRMGYFTAPEFERGDTLLTLDQTPHLKSPTSWE